jgi:hypothetical protein
MRMVSVKLPVAVYVESNVHVVSRGLPTAPTDPIYIPPPIGAPVRPDHVVVYISWPFAGLKVPVNVPVPVKEESGTGTICKALALPLRVYGELSTGIVSSSSSQPTLNATNEKRKADTIPVSIFFDKDFPVFILLHFVV